MAERIDIEVRRGNIREARIVESPRPHAGDGEAVLRVEAFAFTANNVTYAAFGDAMRYWDFFPAEEGWGRIPVWGFATVVESTVEALPPGDRIYGYFPMASHLTVRPAKVTANGFLDGSAHRAALPPVYNAYLRCAADPAYDPSLEDAQMIFRPLFTTSFLIDDMLGDNGFFGADAVLFTSASSKTALGAAWTTKRRAGPRPQVIGLTSAGNAKFCEGTGAYDQVVTYEGIASLDPALKIVLVDMAGNAGTIATVHRHFGANTVYSMRVGGTHWEKVGGVDGLPGAAPTLFFAPAQIQKRRADWGPTGLDERLAGIWRPFLADAGRWLKVQHSQGPAAAQQVLLATVSNQVAPDVGHILSL